MKVAIVGSTGYIAGYLINQLKKEERINQILKIDQHETADEFLNLQEPENFNYESLNDIDYIVFTAAISGPDKCASDFDFCWKINVTGTKYFINEAIKRNCNVLFFSSDAVFGDIPGEIYNENSITQASTPYGRMKKAIEDEFKGDNHFKAIRLSYVASARDRYISYCLECMKTNTTAEVFHPFYRNVIVVSDVVNVVMWFAYHWDEYKPFVLNVAGEELVSRVRMADELNRLFDYKLKYMVTSPDDSFYENRPKITQMKSLYLKEYNILEKRTFTERLKEELKDIFL
jgi:dTDP-4-dehydrorhamnose reductase